MIKWLRRFMELIGDWDHLIRRKGLRSSVCYIFKQITTLPYRHILYVVLARPLSDAVPELESQVPVDIRPFDSNDLDFVREEFLLSEANLCNERLKQNQSGFVALIDSQPAGYGWLSDDSLLERVKLNLKKGDILATDAFTAPAYRNKGIQTTLAITKMKLAKSMGYKRLIVYIDVDNAPSLAVWHRKLGGKIINHLDYKRYGVWRKTRYV